MMLEPDVTETGPLAPPMAAPGTYVTFNLADQTFGVEVGRVREILDCQRVSRLPNAAPDCDGVIDTRGQSIPMIDLAGRLGIARSEPGPDTRIIVFEIPLQGQAQPVGVLADRVLNVSQIGADQIEPAPPAALSQGRAQGLGGIARLGEGLVVLIDVAEILGDAHAPIF